MRRRYIVKLPGMTEFFTALSLWFLLVMGGGYLSVVPTINVIIPFFLFGVYVIIVFIQKGRIPAKKIQGIMLCFTYLVILYLINLSQGADFSSYARIGMDITTVILFNHIMKERDRFIILYVKVMLFICVYACICYFLNLIFNYTVVTPMLGTLYKIWMGQNVKYFWRNSGPFWEPGIFQIYINIALFFTLFFLKNKYNRTPRLYVIIFGLTIITTVSTTGLLIFAGILAWKMVSVARTTKGNRNKVIASFIVPIALLVGFVFVISTPTVADKFQTNNGSLIRRTADLVEVIPIIREAGPFGKGAETRARRNLMIRHGIGLNGDGNSIAYSSIASTYGWLTLLLFMLRILKVCRKNYSEQWFLLYGIFLVEWLSGVIMMVPLYYFFFVGFEITEETKSKKMAMKTLF